MQVEGAAVDIQAMSSYHLPSFVRCPECGDAVGAAGSAHVCEAKLALDFHMLALREGIERFEQDFWSYLETAQGHLAEWLARRKR